MGSHVGAMVKAQEVYGQCGDSQTPSDPGRNQWPRHHHDHGTLKPEAPAPGQLRIAPTAAAPAPAPASDHLSSEPSPLTVPNRTFNEPFEGMYVQVSQVQFQNGFGVTLKNLFYDDSVTSHTRA